MKRFTAIGLIATAVVAFAMPAGASDKSTAKKLVITQADVDGEFTAQRDSSDARTFAKVAECVGKPVKNRKVTARVVGPLLVQAEKDQSISSSFTIVKTAKMAEADRAVLASSKTPRCVAQVAEEQGAENVTVQRAEVEDFGDYATAVLASYETQGGTFSAVEVAVIKGRGELDATFTVAGDTPFDRQEGEAILEQVVARIDKAKV